MHRSCKFASVLITSTLIVLLCGLYPAFAPEHRVHAQQRFATGSLPPPQFADPDRARKLATAFPEVERLFSDWVQRHHMPGAVLGIVVDGELVWDKSAGVHSLESRAAVTPQSLFRIASMTKSFTAMAILKLRDEGKLSLDDPVARYVPGLADLEYPTRDSPMLTIRHLLTHSEGFPEDNPWGDRQLAQSNETISAWMRAGIPFSNAPGTAYEYSNYGFAILGQVVARASGKPYADYVRDNILLPLGMHASTFEVSDVPPDDIALGYRWEDNAWKNEPALAHGAFGAMGGLWTTARDLARYVAFLMSAFPPRDDAEQGPIRRSSAREMQQAWRWRPASVIRSSVDAALELDVSAYGYGLRISQDCRFSHVVGHGGGLPGYGSLMRWLPDYGVGLIAMGNVTYASFAGLFNDALIALLRTGALQPRVVQPSPALLSAQNDVSRLIAQWDNELALRIAADNLFQDETAERRAARFREFRTKHGACRSAGAIVPENALRGKWRMTCERGWLDVAITLAPTQPPLVQYLKVESVLPPGAEMRRTIETVLQLMKAWDGKTAQSVVAPGFDVERMRTQLAAASSWGGCRVGDFVGGDGMRDSTVKLSCDHVAQALVLRLSLDPVTHRLTSFNLAPTGDERCVP